MSSLNSTIIHVNNGGIQKMTYLEYVAKQRRLIAERHSGEQHLIIRGEYFKVAQEQAYKGVYKKLAQLHRFNADEVRRAFN